MLAHELEHEAFWSSDSILLRIEYLELVSERGVPWGREESTETALPLPRLHATE
jgi:hypothetical protein